jgi:RNA polymerase sigma-70 factor (ECF subfamily)
LEDCPQLCAEEASLEQSYIRQENKIMLHRCMKRLKPEYQQVLWLAYFEGFSYQQIGRIMRKTTHSVETLAYRARLALKKILTEEGFEYENL